MLEYLEANLNPELQFQLHLNLARLEPSYAMQSAERAGQLALINAINQAAGPGALALPVPPVVPPAETVARARLRQWKEHVKKLSEQVAANQGRLKSHAEAAIAADRARRCEQDRQRPAKSASTSS